LIRKERGYSLLEVLIALAILGLISAAFLMALSAAPRALFIADQRATAETLALSQMEHAKNQPYDPTPPIAYSLLPDIPAGFSIDVAGEHFDANRNGIVEVPGADAGIQKITVTVRHHGEVIFTLEGYKVDR
jgi:prepilin-type N-terminal cleavage/methylation domain-containing protein